jgi:hypothetical protein
MKQKKTKINKSHNSGATLFGWNSVTAVLGKNYTIGNQPGVVGQYLILQLNTTINATISMAEIEVLAGK